MESGSEETEWTAETYSLGAVRSDVGLTRAVIPSVTTNREISRWSCGVLEHWKSITQQLQYSWKGITNRDDARYKLWFWKVNSYFHHPHFIEGVVADEG
jgi:hypothetical protein